MTWNPHIRLSTYIPPRGMHTHHADSMEPFVPRALILLFSTHMQTFSIGLFRLRPNAGNFFNAFSTASPVSFSAPASPLCLSI